MIRFASSITALLTLLLAGCSSSPYDDMSSRVSEFITMYFNDFSVESVADTPEGGTVVTMHHGPVVTFDSDGSWTSINGRGGTLPAILITDQLPERVVNYLTEMEETAGVYSLVRSWHYLRVDLAHNYFTYDDRTDTLTYPEIGPK